MANDLLAMLADASLRAKLPAGMRNNNPGNIKYVGQKVPGIVGPSVNTDQGDPQAVFDSPESGMRAMYQLLSRKYSGGKLTPNQMIAGEMGWTPGNFQAAANVAKYAGISPDDDIGLSDPSKAGRFIRALMRQEHGNSSDLYTDDMIAKALGAAPLQAMPRGPDGPKGQESYPVFGGMAPQPIAVARAPSNASPPIIPSAVQQTAGVAPGKSMADIFGMMAMAPQQGPQFSPVQIAGPSGGQANGLLQLVQALKGRIA